MFILISGASGLIGRAVSERLTRAGHTVIRLVRSHDKTDAASIYWDPAHNQFDSSQLPAIDVVINLCGYSLASARWTRRRMKTIYDSRVDSTHLLVEGICSLGQPPRVMISASAVGYYGDCGDELVSEEYPPGRGFLADLCRDWEAAAAEVTKQGVRLVTLRSGIVLTQEGGMLQRLLPLFRLGLGGRLGDGQAWMSWLSLHDMIEVILFAIENESLSGPINAVAPQTVTNTEFTQTLARIVKRPAIFTVPTLALRILFGRMADEALLLSTRAEPKALTQHGFQFSHPDLDSAMRHAVS